MYKTVIYQFDEDGKDVGASVVTKDFDSSLSALKYGKEYMLSDLSIVEVRRYDERNGCVVAVGTPADTGEVVARYKTGVEVALERKLTELREKYQDEFEGTMSYLIDLIKDGAEEDGLSKLKGPVNCLTDDEVNFILSMFGDAEYMVCVNGELQPVEKEPEV